MRIAFSILLLTLLGATQLQAQCGSCPTVSGEVIDHCFCLTSHPKQCVQFMEDAKSFYYQDLNRKKGNPMKFELPADLAAPDTDYLLGLAADKKLKLSATDLLIIEAGINEWRQIEGIRTWNPDIINSGFTLLPSGLAYKPLKIGTGNLAESGQRVTVHYTGYLINGEKFDSSLDRKKSFQFTLGKGQVIKGWDEGLALMTVGSRYLLRIPADLGYGSRGAGKAIPPNAVLFFDVQLLAVE